MSIYIDPMCYINIPVCIVFSRMPLNTIIDPSFDICQQNHNESNNSDTDSAVESIDNKVDAETSKRYSKRRLRRTRQVENLSTDEFKIPPLPGASKSVTSSTDSCSSSDESSSETVRHPFKSKCYIF